METVFSSRPSWVESLIRKRATGVANTFILYGNIFDLVPVFNGGGTIKYISLKEYLADLFAQRSLVCFYNISSGLSFKSPEMAKLFRDLQKCQEVEEKDDEDGSSGGSNKGSKAQSALKSGLARIQEKKAFPREAEIVLPMIEKALINSEDGQAVVFIEYAHMITPSSSGSSLGVSDRINTVAMECWAKSPQMRQKNNVAILLTRNISDMAEGLRDTSSGIETIFIPRPRYEERLDFVKALNERKQCLPPDMSEKHLALMTNGLSYGEIQEVFSEFGSETNLSHFESKKQDVYRQQYGDIIEVINAIYGPEYIAGLDYALEYLRKISRAIGSGDFRRVPQGITIMGPPGTGKTALAEALAVMVKEFGFNCVRSKNLRNMFVGSSEGRQEKFFEAILNLSPVIVIEDEADQNDVSRDSYQGDSGVSNRMRRGKMEFMSRSDIRGRVLWISLTNRPDLIDPALLRSGRSDDRFALLMPDCAQREAIFEKMFKKHRIGHVIEDFGVFAEMSNGWSGADIENVVLHSFRFLKDEDGEAVCCDLLRRVVEDFIPQRASKSDIDRMTKFAIEYTSFRSLLPPNYNGSFVAA